MASKQPMSIIDGLLIVCILGLITLLVYVIWEPGQMMAQHENMKWESRARMSALRTAEIQYFNSQGRYTADLDSLISFSQNSLSKTTQDSLYTKLYIGPFSFDSLRFSPLNHLPYQISVNDTSQVRRYQITCPDGFGSVSSLTNPDEHNKASWEQ